MKSIDKYGQNDIMHIHMCICTSNHFQAKVIIAKAIIIRKAVVTIKML